VKNRYSLKKRSFLFCFSLVFISLLLMASEQALLSSKSGEGYDLKKIRVNEQILRGIDLIYEREFDDAEDLFEEVIAKSQDESAGYFYLAMVAWGRLAAGFWYPEAVKRFEERIDRAIEVAETRIDKNGADIYDFFYLGGALGFKGRFELMKDNWLSSFFLARDAVGALQTCLKMDPDNKDVLFGIGTFDYYTARFSGIKRFLAYLLLHEGDKEEGLRKLTIASKEAVYSATEAKSMLLHIYLFFDPDFNKALDLSTKLASTYMRNSRFKLLQGVSYIRLGMDQQYRETAIELRQRSVEASKKERSSIWKKQALYLESIYDLFHERLPEARSKLKRILDHPDPKADPAMIAWPLMKIGMSYDLENNRDEAIKYYEQVLNMENGAGAQVLANKFLKTPPKQGNPFLGY